MSCQQWSNPLLCRGLAEEVAFLTARVMSCQQSSFPPPSTTIVKIGGFCPLATFSWNTCAKRVCVISATCSLLENHRECPHCAARVVPARLVWVRFEAHEKCCGNVPWFGKAQSRLTVIQTSGGWFIIGRDLAGRRFPTTFSWSTSRVTLAVDEIARATTR